MGWERVGRLSSRSAGGWGHSHPFLVWNTAQSPRSAPQEGFAGPASQPRAPTHGRVCRWYHCAKQPFLGWAE